MPAWLPTIVKGGLSAAKHLAGSAAVHAFLFKDGDAKKGLKPEAVQFIAPRFSRTQEDEAVVEGVSQRQLKNAERMALGNFRGRLGPNQRNHLSISLAQTYDSNQKQSKSGDEVLAGVLRDLINTEPPLEDPDADREAARHRARVRLCVERGFIRSDEESYPIGWLQGVAGRIFDSAQDLGNWFLETPSVATQPRWRELFEDGRQFGQALMKKQSDSANGPIGRRLAAGADTVGSVAHSQETATRARGFRNRALKRWRGTR